MKNKLSLSKTNMVSRFWKNLLSPPIFNSEDSKRKAYILNVILISFFVLALFSFIFASHSYFFVNSHHKTISSLLPSFVICLLPVFLLKLSVKGHIKTSALILISLLLLAILQTTYFRGVNIPAAVVAYALVIFMSGILVGPKSSVILTGIITAAMLLIFYLQNSGFVEIDYNWKDYPVTVPDILVLNLIYLVIAIISWLSSKEISKSLKRAKKSEKEALILAKKLKKQNENLEKIVDIRTKELREHQLKQLMEINTLAEFGRLSAGLLHDINNPLTVISMNLDSIKNCTKDDSLFKREDLYKLVKKSLLASRTVESIIKTSQKQLVGEDKMVLFDVKREIKNTLLLLETRANKSSIKIEFQCPSSIKISGSPAKLSRVVANLIMNSIDSFNQVKRKFPIVQISIKKDKKILYISVTDNGCGIEDKYKNNIFQPLFSTKNNQGGTGLGLYISQKIIREYFKGEILFDSVLGKGSNFIIKIPLNNFG